MQGAGLTIGRNFEFSILPKETWTYGAGDQTVNPVISGQSALPPEPQVSHPISQGMQTRCYRPVSITLSQVGSIHFMSCTW